MSSKGKQWIVPKRQQCVKEIERVKALVVSGLTMQQVADEMGVTRKKVDNIISKHTPGVRRLRQDAVGLEDAA